MDSISKNLLKQVAGLKQKKFRDETGLYVISGDRAVDGALYGIRNEIRYVLCTAEKTGRVLQIQEQYPFLKDTPCFLVPEHEFRRLSDEQTPQGIALVCHKPDTRLAPDTDPGNRLIYLDRINDPGNLGTIIRTALWFGIEGILLSNGSADPFQGKTVRASAGAITRIKVYEDISITTLERLKQTFGYALLATIVQGGKSPGALPVGERRILLFGSEAAGLDPQFIGMSDHTLSIPRPGSGESLNLAVAVGLFLYELADQKS